MKKIFKSIFIIAALLLTFTTTNVPALAAGEGACKSDQTGFSEFDGLTTVDLLARLIYSEAGGESMNGKKAIAKIVENRVAKNLTEFGGASYKGVILNPVGGFDGMRTSLARCPATSNQDWKDSLTAANDYSSVNIGQTLWFNTTDLFTALSRNDNGYLEYRFPATSNYKRVVERIVIGNHTFFKVSGY